MKEPSGRTKFEKFLIEMFFVDLPLRRRPIQPKSVVSAMPGFFCPARDWPKPSLGRE